MELDKDMADTLATLLTTKNGSAGIYAFILTSCSANVVAAELTGRVVGIGDGGISADSND